MRRGGRGGLLGGGGKGEVEGWREWSYGVGYARTPETFWIVTS